MDELITGMLKQNALLIGPLGERLLCCEERVQNSGTGLGDAGALSQVLLQFRDPIESLPDMLMRLSQLEDAFSLAKETPSDAQFEDALRRGGWFRTRFGIDWY